MKTFISAIFILLFTLQFSAQKVFSVVYQSQADVKVFMVKYESQADLKMFFVKYQSQAGWNKKGKKQLMF